MSSGGSSTPKEVIPFVSPFAELNAGLWLLFAGATFFLGLRLWCKVTRRQYLWYDDHILLFSWALFLTNNAIIVHEFATGYILEDTSKKWDDRMHILINVSSSFMVLNQAISKTAFGFTLLRLSNQWQKWVLWFAIGSMNLWMILRVFFQWARVCDKKNYQEPWRLGFCIGDSFRDDFKEGGNVYNVLMDILFAAFPWVITMRLDMRKAEKISLCLTMSLGMIVAIVAAIRIAWKDNGNDRDAYYIYRNGLSQVWYSSEIAGTIIVQCIPVLRPLVREMHASYGSRFRKSSFGTLQSDSEAGKQDPWTSADRGTSEVEIKGGAQVTSAPLGTPGRRVDKELPLPPIASVREVSSPTEAVSRGASWLR